MPDISLMSAKTGRFLNENSEVKNIIELITGAVKIITSDHAAIHKKEGYHAAGIFSNVANAETVNYAFKTPTAASGKIMHWKFTDMFANGTKVRTDLYEAPTNDPINGSDIAMINRSRIVPVEVSVMQAFKAAMDIDLTGATALEPKLFGSAAGPRPLDIEYDMNPDTWYIRTITNLTGAAADINFFEFWYEEDAV